MCHILILLLLCFKMANFIMIFYAKMIPKSLCEFCSIRFTPGPNQIIVDPLYFNDLLQYDIPKFVCHIIYFFRYGAASFDLSDLITSITSSISSQFEYDQVRYRVYKPQIAIYSFPANSPNAWPMTGGTTNILNHPHSWTSISVGKNNDGIFLRIVRA